ncbi:MAG: DUF58 domain-containing protein [Deltaproteobacteria bacterium]|nr:DUF58 domain-containing protein [Deltaproteobacteria bacterium]
MQVFLVVFFFISLLYGFRDLVLFTGILLGVGFGASIWCRLSPKNIRCDLRVDRVRVFPEERLQLHIRAVNAKFLPVLLKIAVRFDRSITGPEHEDTGFSSECGLLWYQGSSFQKELIFHRRGFYRLGPPSLSVGDLFGFYSKEIKSRISVDVIVYPRLVEIKPLSLPRRDFYGVPGARSPVEDPVYIYGTRDYQPSSPARRIHWKASARHNRLQEKLCEPTEQEKLLILLDVSRFADVQAEEALERIIEAAASYTVWLDRQGYAVGFATNARIAGGGSSIIPISRSPMQLSRILEALARMRIISEGSLMDILTRGVDLPWGLSCLVFAYEEGDATSKLKAHLRNRKIPATFLCAQKPAGLYDDQRPGRERHFALDDLAPGEKPDS